MARLGNVTLFLLSLMVPHGCSDTTSTQEVVATKTVEATETSDSEIAQNWARSCSLCHATGVAGAPRIGNVEEWRPRVAKGKDVLLKNTIEGFNDMPPLGYCMSCEEDDFVALIEFMSEDF